MAAICANKDVYNIVTKLYKKYLCNCRRASFANSMHGLFSDAVNFCKKLAVRIKAKFHNTDPTGPDWTRTDFVGDPHGPTEFLGDPGRSGPCGSARVRAGPVGSV